MVNLFPDIVQIDSPSGRKATCLYVTLLISGLLACTLFYSLQVSDFLKTASSSDSYFGLEMYQGTTNCDASYACLYKTQGANPTVTGLVCQCSSQAGQLSRMTRYPLAPETVSFSGMCLTTLEMQKYMESNLPQLTDALLSTQEPVRAFNFFSSESACANAHTSTGNSNNEYSTFDGPSSANVLSDIATWRLNSDAAVGTTATLRLSPGSVPDASVAAAWLLRDAFIDVDVSAAAAAKDAANSAAGLTTAKTGGSSVKLGDFCSRPVEPSSGPNLNPSVYWPLVIQINSRCNEKKKEADMFLRALDSTFIISSTLLNQDSYNSFHKAQRVLQSEHFTVAPAAPGMQMENGGDPFAKYATLGERDYLEGLDNVQVFYPSYSPGYALAYAEYTQRFVLQYYGEFTSGPHSCMTASSSLVPACQLTFEERLKSVFPLNDAGRARNFESSTKPNTEILNQIRVVYA
jgi:hypothetical protein